MDSGYYAAITGLLSRMESLDVAANNLANASTTGYKALDEFYSSKASGTKRAQASALNRAANDYGVLGGARVNLSSGSIEKTGNDLDFAFNGPGFFVVQAKGGQANGVQPDATQPSNEVRYTRNGTFHVSADGYLVSSNGERVLGESGPIQLGSDAVSLTPDGTLTQGGGIVAKLKIVDIEASKLSPEGNALYSAPSDAAQPINTPSLRQGAIEASNLNGVKGTVSLIVAQRHAEMLQRVFTIFNIDFNKTAMEEIARV